MRALLTSNGITNATLRRELVELLGRPIEEADALFVPTGVLPFAGGFGYAYDAVCGRHAPKLAGLGWRSVGLLDVASLPSLDEEVWVPAVREAHALLFWGGDPVFLTDAMRRSGLADLLPTLGEDAVYVGVSAGSIAATSTFAETYLDPPNRPEGALPSEAVVLSTPDGPVERLLVTGHGVGLVDVAVIPHFGNPDHYAGSEVNVELWASRIPAPTYALDDDSALSLRNGTVRVVSEGRWHLFEA